MNETPKLDLLAILRTLVDHDVDFIVVGGVAATLAGTPMSTFDLDVVHSTDSANVERLLSALENLQAFYRSQPERKLKPEVSHLRSAGHQLLMTRFGPLDLLGNIGRNRRYADLLRNTVEVDVGGGNSVRALDLETIIETKQESARDKDLAVLPVLRRTLEEKRRKREQAR